MSFVDHSAHSMLNVSAYKGMAIEIADNIRTIAGNAMAFSKGDDVFAASRLKSARLPAIESCQTSIFRELRCREAMQARANGEETVRPARVGLFGRVFAQTSTSLQ